MTKKNDTHPAPEEEAEAKGHPETPESAPETAEGTDWRAKAEEYLEDLKRLKADFENYKKRKAASEAELGAFLTEKLVLDLVPVLDNFQAATAHVPEDQKGSPWVVGIQHIERGLMEVLERHGIALIKAAPGEPFDPRLHEAVADEGEEKEGEAQAGSVIKKVYQKGYRHGERVLRPAKVSVSL
jgi:molecular chaperone GrpE